MFDRMYYGTEMPVQDIAEMQERDDAICDKCNELIEDDGYYDGDGHYYCFSCMDELVAEVAMVAIEFAKENCRITKPLPRFNPKYEYRVSREEYELGNKDCYTENSLRAQYRHCCTNYDKLIAGLDCDSIKDNVYYEAIRERIEDMIDEKVDMDDLVDEEYM